MKPFLRPSDSASDATQRGLCHIEGMVNYTVEQRGKQYWIDGVEGDGRRVPIEAHSTEERAQNRVRTLQQRDEVLHRAEQKLSRSW